MLLLFFDLLEKKGAISFQNISLSLINFKLKFSKYSFFQDASDSDKGFFAVCMPPCFQRIVFSNIDFAIVTET